MKHDTKMTASARAILAAGQHLSTKDGGDVLDIITKKFGDHADEVVRRLTATDKELKAVSSRFDEVERKANRARLQGPAEPVSWGQEFTQAKEAEIRGLAEMNQGRVSMNVKAITTDPASAGSLDVPKRDQGVLMPKRRLTVRDLLNVISISTGSVEYASQTTAPIGADVVAEGALKPESDMDWELKTTSSKVIAHWVKASRQILEDVPQLRDLIDSEMRYGLAIKEEQQLLTGTGIGANLLGMIPEATAYVDPLGTAGNNEIDVIGKAILQTALADFPANGIVIHPADWWKMRLLKDADGTYVLGNAQAVVQPSLFGLPVVATKAMAVGSFLVGDFASAATLYDRWSPRVETGYVNDDFTRNLVTVLAEERIAFAVKQPTALTFGSFAP